MLTRVRRPLPNDSQGQGILARDSAGGDEALLPTAVVGVTVDHRDGSRGRGKAHIESNHGTAIALRYFHALHLRIDERATESTKDSSIFHANAHCCAGRGEKRREAPVPQPDEKRRSLRAQRRRHADVDACPDLMEQVPGQDTCRRAIQQVDLAQGGQPDEEIETRRFDHRGRISSGRS